MKKITLALFTSLMATTLFAAGFPTVIVTNDKEVGKAKCPTSPYWSAKYQEEIEGAVCLSINNAFNSKKTIRLDTISKKFAEWDRVLVEIVDLNGDNKADWIRITNYLYSKNSNRTPPYRYGSEGIEFYHGDGQLKSMVEEYGWFLEKYKTMSIDSDEMGTTYYNGASNGLQFKPIEDERIIALFSFSDELLAHDGATDGLFQTHYSKEIHELLKTPVMSYPSEWKAFNRD